MTPTLVRDELLKCFESANKEFMHVFNQPTNDEALKAQVQAVRDGLFPELRGELRPARPRQGIVTAIGQCKSNAEAMMGPKGIGHNQAPLRRDDEARQQAARKQVDPSCLVTFSKPALTVEL